MSHRERRPPGRTDLPVRAVIGSAARAGRSGAGRILLIAIGISCLSTAVEVTAHSLVDEGHGLWVLASFGTAAVSMLGVVFLSGFLSQQVGQASHGRPEVSLPELLRNLPWRWLILADLLVVVIVVAGLVALIIPGLLALNLFAVVGPVVEIERRRPIAALRRSAQLARLHFWKVALLATLPVALTEELPALPHESVSGAGLLYVIGVQGVAEGIVEAAIGLVLAELCYRLIELDRAHAATSAAQRAGIAR